MPMDNYPGGFKDGILIRGVPLHMAHPGKVYWVGNASAAALPGQKTASDGNDGTFNAPFSTLSKAISLCVADRGDIVFIKPGHTETVTAAAGVVFDKAGTAYVGLGSGTKRPKISFTTAATADVDITAGNQTFYNIEFQANFADVTAGIDVSGVDGLTFQNCYFTEGATDLNFVDTIDLATGADDIMFDNCKFIGNDAANDSFITGVAHDGFYISNCYFAMNTAQTAVVGLIESSGNVTNMWIRDSFFRSNVDGALFLDFNGAANGGGVVWCHFSSIDTAGAVTAGFDLTGAHAFEVYVAGEADSYAIVGGGTAYNNA